MIALNTVVHNEEPRIIQLLIHASRYCDELVVVDQDSDDGTDLVAKDFGAKVIHDEHRGSNEPSRELAAENTESDWILALDADEYLSDDAIKALPMIMASHPGAAFNRLNTVDGVRVGPTRPDGTFHHDYQFRFFKKGRVTFDPGVHGRIRPLCMADCFAGPPDPWIIHAKTSAEQEYDDLRYREIANAVGQR